jgi:hypothetical protein
MNARVPTLEMLPQFRLLTRAGASPVQKPHPDEGPATNFPIQGPGGVFHSAAMLV